MTQMLQTSTGNYCSRNLCHIPCNFLSCISAICFMKQVYICFLCSSKLNNHGSSLRERRWNAMNIEAYPLLRLCQPVLSPISFHYHHNDDVLVTSGAIVFRVCLEGVHSDSTVLSSKVSTFSLAACCHKYSSGAVESLVRDYGGGWGTGCEMDDRPSIAVRCDFPLPSSPEQLWPLMKATFILG